MRYCWLMRILVCPLRSPFNLSNLFPGGTERSFKSIARFSWSIFRRATGQRCLGHRFLAPAESVPSKMSSVPLSPKVCITHHVIQYNDTRCKSPEPYNIELSRPAVSPMAKPSSRAEAGLKANQRRTQGVGFNDLLCTISVSDAHQSDALRARGYGFFFLNISQKPLGSTMATLLNFLKTSRSWSPVTI